MDDITSPIGPTLIRDRVAAAVAARGVYPVSRDLGVSPHSVATYLLGRCRPGTALMIERGAADLRIAPGR